MTRSLIAGATVVLALAAAPPAQAAHDPLAGGATTLRLDRAVAQALGAAGVTVAVVGPARARAAGIAFPITGGRLDSGTARGVVEHSGGLRLRAGGRSLVMRSFTVRLGARPTLTARVGNARVPLLTLNTRRARISRPGLGTRISGVRVALTATAASALNATFSTHMFRRGLELGAVTVRATPESVSLRRSGATTLTLDPGAASALQSLGIEPSLVAPATSLAFPITGGRVNAETFAGTIRHAGGIALSRGSTRVELTSFTIQINDAPDLTALVGGQRTSILGVDVSALQPSVRAGAITLAGASLKLTAAAAAALNQAFATTAFGEGLTLATASVEASS